jgi:hypothetical protein
MARTPKPPTIGEDSILSAAWRHAMRSTTDVRSASANSERRLRTVGDRVACPRIGTTDLLRCAECVYLLRLGRRYTVCVDGEITDQPDFAW